MSTTTRAAFVLLATCALSGATPSATAATLTGTVGDAMCGVTHVMKDKAACTRACFKKGSHYALVVKDKAYTLLVTDAQRAELDKLAGKAAEVTGEVIGRTITVESVKMGVNPTISTEGVNSWPSHRS